MLQRDAEQLQRYRNLLKRDIATETMTTKQNDYKEMIKDYEIARKGHKSATKTC